MKEDAKKTRLYTSRDEPTATTTAERALSNPRLSHTGQPRAHRRCPRRGAHRRHRPRRRLWCVKLIKKNLAERANRRRPSVSSLLSLPSSLSSAHLFLFTSPTNLISGCGKSTFMRRMTGVFGGAPLPPAGELKFAFFRPRDRPKNGKTQARRKTLTSPLDLFSLFFLSLSSSHLHTNFQAATPTPTRSSPT